MSAGRKRKRWNDECKRSYCEEINANPLPENVGKASKTKKFFRRGCGKHLAFISVETANKPPTEQSWHHCKLCRSDEKKASQGERRFAEIVQRKMPQAWVVTQPCLLQKEGAVDFLLMSYDGAEIGRCQPTCLLVEIDGRQHYDDNMHNTTAEQQWDRDRRKDKKALKEGFKLLRLHGQEKGEWEKELERAYAAAKKKPNAAFNFYSTQYRKYIEEVEIENIFDDL